MNYLGLVMVKGRDGRSPERNRRTAGRSRRPFRPGQLDTLESRLLLATSTQTFTAGIPPRATDFTAPVALPRFDPALGTLTEVDLSLAAGGTAIGTVTNTSAGPESFLFTENERLTLSNGATSLLATTLVSSQNYTNLAAGASAQFGPFAPTNNAANVFTSGPDFNAFSGGPGNINLTFQTRTSQTITGGGGNVGSNLITTAGGTVSVTYKYTPLPVTLAGNVYEDRDGSGSLTPADAPIPGTVLTLIGPGGVTATTTTGADGSYRFTTDSNGNPLDAGTYKITETQPAGFLEGTNTVGTVNGVTDGVLVPVDMIGSIVLAAGQASVGNNFGEVRPVTVAGNVYEDRDGSGTLTPADAPIPGTVLTLTGPGGVTATTTTGPGGTYAFTTDSNGNPLAPGTYKVTETQPAGFLEGSNTVGTVNGTTDGVLVPVDMIGSIVLGSGQASVGNNFGEVLPVTIAGNVYQDRDGSGSLTTGDTPIPGVVLTLTGPGGVTATTTTGPGGTYTFTTDSNGNPLAPGTYKVTETQPAGFLEGSNTVGTVNGVTDGVLVPVDMIGSIALGSGQASIGNNFGELAPAPVSPPLNLVNVQRFGVHLQPTLIVLTFDTPLNPASAQDVSHYRLFGPLDSKRAVEIPIISASYNPVTQTVTLHTARRLDVHHPYRLTVVGLVNSTGSVLNGTDGQPGGIFSARVNRSLLSGFTDIYGNFVPIDHGKLYPAAIAAGYHLKQFVGPDNLGPFAAANRATFLDASVGESRAHFRKTPAATVHLTRLGHRPSASVVNQVRAGHHRSA